MAASPDCNWTTNDIRNWLEDRNVPFDRSVGHMELVRIAQGAAQGGGGGGGPVGAASAPGAEYMYTPTLPMLVGERAGDRVVPWDYNNFGDPLRRQEYFVEWRLVDPMACDAVWAVKTALVAADPTLYHGDILIDDMHMTMNEMKINSEAELRHAVELLENFKQSEFLTHVPDQEAVVLDLQGIHTFGDRVMYLGLSEGAPGTRVLHRLYDKLHEAFTSAGFEVKDRGAFHPHMTICKAGGRGKNARLSPTVLQAVRDHGFDTNVIARQNLFELVFCAKKRHGKGGKDETNPPVVWKMTAPPK